MSKASLNKIFSNENLDKVTKALLKPKTEMWLGRGVVISGGTGLAFLVGLIAVAILVKKPVLNATLLAGVKLSAVSAIGLLAIKAVIHGHRRLEEKKTLLGKAEGIVGEVVKSTVDSDTKAKIENEYWKWKRADNGFKSNPALKPFDEALVKPLNYATQYVTYKVVDGVEDLISKVRK